MMGVELGLSAAGAPTGHAKAPIPATITETTTKNAACRNRVLNIVLLPRLVRCVWQANTMRDETYLNV